LRDGSRICASGWVRDDKNLDGYASAPYVQRKTTMSFTIYLIGYLILIIGLAIGAHLLHMPPRWIGVGVIILAGLGILSGVARTRQRD
jgi:hypothetical protein